MDRAKLSPKMACACITMIWDNQPMIAPPLAKCATNDCYHALSPLITQPISALWFWVTHEKILPFLPAPGVFSPARTRCWPATWCAATSGAIRTPIRKRRPRSPRPTKPRTWTPSATGKKTCPTNWTGRNENPWVCCWRWNHKKNNQQPISFWWTIKDQPWKLEDFTWERYCTAFIIDRKFPCFCLAGERWGYHQRWRNCSLSA